MFSLANGKLIRINSDGSDGEPIQTKNPSLTIGTSMLSDCCVSDTTTDPTTHLAYEISKDELGRVSTAAAFARIFFLWKIIYSINGEKTLARQQSIACTKKGAISSAARKKSVFFFSPSN